MGSRIRGSRVVCTAQAAIFVSVILLAQVTLGQTFTVLHAFKYVADGDQPFGGVVRDKAGNLYGTTLTGGSHGLGTIFKIDLSGTEVIVHNFEAGDGAFPEGGLVLDRAGNLYGATSVQSGISPSLLSFGGSIFMLTPSGNLTVLYRFSKNGMPDGFAVLGNLIERAGYLYGTTDGGGTGTGSGTIFEVSARTGEETILYNFNEQPDGSYPLAGLIADADGDFYGTTVLGGAFCFPGCGTVFKLDASGNETVLYSFTGWADGNEPSGGVIRDGEGTLYGTTVTGGAFNQGTIFKLDTAGVLTVLHDFSGAANDGAQPIASGLTPDSKGNFYGTTQYGGAFAAGTVYRLAPDGTFTVLHSFSGGSDGSLPWAGVIRDSDGNLYGTTRLGGDPHCGCGVVFKIAP